MGEFLKAECSCGYKSTTMQLGIGFRYGEDKTYHEAAYCDHCGVIYAIAGGKLSPKCKSCKGLMRYFREDLKKQPQPHFGGMPNTEYLEKRKFWHCPFCKKRKLTFNNHGCWD